MRTLVDEEGVGTLFGAATFSRALVTVRDLIAGSLVRVVSLATARGSGFGG
jgi:hypothetical protein